MTMRKTWIVGILLLGSFLLTPAATSHADDQPLESAYAAILRGDYDAGRAAVDRILEQRQDAPAAKRAHEWLKSYHDVVASRKDLKAKTFNWNIEQAQKAMDSGDMFLALNFAAQAAPYADDKSVFAREPWVQQLTARAKTEAQDYAEQGKWSKALSYYVILSRIHEDNAEIEELKDDATEHARIEFAYEDEEALQRRTRDVDEQLLRNALRMVDHMYYKRPEFRELARGAVDNLLLVSESEKLHEFLDGLANPALRRHFQRKLHEMRRDIDDERIFSSEDLMRLFRRVAAANRESVELPNGLLVVEFTEGLINELDDFTGMIWPVDAAEFEKLMMGGFEGIGIQLGLDERTNRLKVITPLENSPALEAGLHPDDLIVAVDGESTKGWTTDDAVQNIMGPGGTEVILTVKRPQTGEELVFKLVRRRIELTTVRGVNRLPYNTHEWNYMLDQEAGVAYIRLTNFLPKSAQELSRALSTARSQGMQGLVLDVRHNPGGLLDVAIDIVSDFLSSGEVVSTRGRVESDHRERVGGRAPYRDLPLVILVNEGSASASEILAGALQDHNRAIVLGERTFGKGSVQHVRRLGNDAQLKLTTALYYLPSGRTPHKGNDAEVWGVDPDWAVDLTPKEFRKVLERERESYIIHNGDEKSSSKQLKDEQREKMLEALKDEGEDEDEDPPLLSDDDIELLEADPFDAPDVDPQLETALLLIRVKLAAKVPWPRDLAAALEPE